MDPPLPPIHVIYHILKMAWDQPYFLYEKVISIRICENLYRLCYLNFNNKTPRGHSLSQNEGPKPVKAVDISCFIVCTHVTISSPSISLFLKTKYTRPQGHQLIYTYTCKSKFRIQLDFEIIFIDLYNFQYMFAINCF